MIYDLFGSAYEFRRFKRSISNYNLRVKSLRTEKMEISFLLSFFL
jgi:hypothetical protein